MHTNSTLYARISPQWLNELRRLTECSLTNFVWACFLIGSHTSETCQGTFIQLSQLADPLWTDPGIKSWISVHELISTTKKKKKKAQARNEWLNIFPKYSQARKKPPRIYKPLVLSCDNHWPHLLELFTQGCNEEFIRKLACTHDW